MKLRPELSGAFFLRRQSRRRKKARTERGIWRHKK